MKRHYPRTKWSDTETSQGQLDSVRRESQEVRNEVLRLMSMGLSPTMDRVDEEMADLEHSIQTYWDCREREGADVEAIRQAVVEKNRQRGYYPGV